MEEWRDVVGYEGLYQVSSKGRVKSVRGRQHFIKCPHLRSLRKGKYGYFVVTVRVKGITHHFYVHRLVAFAFLQRLGDADRVNHKDGDRFNNCVANLEWCTAQQNTHHAIATGLMPDQIGERNNCSKITDEIVRAIRAEHTRRYGCGRMLATRYNVSPATVSLVVNRKLWAHVL